MVIRILLVLLSMTYSIMLWSCEKESELIVTYPKPINRFDVEIDELLSEVEHDLFRGCLSKARINLDRADQILPSTNDSELVFPLIRCFSSEEYGYEIQGLTEAIDSYPEGLCPTELKNTRGLCLLLSQDFESASADFEDIIGRYEDGREENLSLYASALWGNFLAKAFSNQAEESLSNLFLIRKLFLYGKSRCKNVNLSLRDDAYGREFSKNLIAEFAYPDEKLTPEECKQRVKATALAMKALCIKIPNANIRFAAEVSIVELEEKAYACCEREHWTECLSPIVDAWKYLKECMDKGVKYAPYLLFPSSIFHLEKKLIEPKGLTNV